MLIDLFHKNPDLLSSMIDHTFLKPFGTSAQIEKLCSEAAEYHFAMVAIQPSEVVHCVHLVQGTNVRVGAAIGFPLGQNTSAVKLYETRDAIDNGATEIDMVINIRALQSGDTALVYREISELALLCSEHHVTSKVILETCYLSDQEKQIACHLSSKAGVDFVKTSTGFGPGGATIEDVQLMRGAVSASLQVKASGGIRDLRTTLMMIDAGATRIGTSNGVQIMQQLANSHFAQE